MEQENRGVQIQGDRAREYRKKTARKMAHELGGIMRSSYSSRRRQLVAERMSTLGPAQFTLDLLDACSVSNQKATATNTKPPVGHLPDHIFLL